MTIQKPFVPDLTITRAVDVGNGRVKIDGEDMPEPMVYPTVIDDTAQMDVLEESNDPMRQLDFNITQSATIPTGRAFYGTMAVKTRLGQSMSPNNDKATDPTTLRFLLCALAASVCDHLDRMPARARTALLQARGDRPLNVLVHLGTGLPIKSMLKDGGSESFRKNLRGSHTVRFETTRRWRSYGDITLRIGELRVAAEGYAVLSDLIWNLDGSLRDARLKEGHTFVADIGENTWDGAYFRPTKDGPELENSLLQPLESQLGEQMEKITGSVNKRYSRTLKRHTLEEYIFQYGHAIPNGANPPISIRDMTEPVLKALASLYADRIKQAFDGSGAEMTDLVMVGGGAILIKPFIIETLADSSRFPTGLPFRVHWPETGIFANVSGYYKIILQRLRDKAEKAAKVETPDAV